ncbi:MAG: 30S ribosomal protein S8, partial [Clostridia bacterium]|nr:30S ribosomal protein S8 [Clostridia bacterium]
MTDPIADMLTRIRNALAVNKETVEIPSSNMKKAIADIMLKEGYISDVKLVEDGYSGKLVVTLKYVGKKQSVINALQRVSRPGLRVYANVENMPKVM